MRFFLVLVH